MKKITQKHINDYLHFSYIPEFGDNEQILDLLKFEGKNAQIKSDKSEEDLIVEGISVLNQVFDELVEGKQDQKHLVPLSGGLDSRVILFALLQRVDPKNIQAVSFGSPKSLDYEIPKDVVKGTGVNLERINCIELDYSLENLVEAAQNGGSWTFTPDIYVNRLSLKLDQDFCRWSGFIGDFIAGSYTHRGDSAKDHYKKFAASQKRSRTKILTEAGYVPKKSVVNIDEKKLLNLNKLELIALYNRITACTAPILFPNNAELITPLIHPKWVEFMFGLPEKHRRGSSLFKKVITKMFPEALAIRCKNNHGLPLNNKSKLSKLQNKVKLKMHHEISKYKKDVNYPPIGVNYLHYAEAMRSLPSLKKSVETACESLDERNVAPWLNPSKIFKEHLDRKADHSEALLVILGLEVNLKADEQNH